MSKLFDEYVAEKKKVVGSTYFTSTVNKILPMIRKTQEEKELENELDDRLLISIVIMQTNNGMSLKKIIETYKLSHRSKIELIDEVEKTRLNREVPTPREEKDVIQLRMKRTETERKIRLIEAVHNLVKSNQKFTYGDIILLVDDDSSELEYEASKKENNESNKFAQK